MVSKAGTLASLGVWLRQPQTAAPARYALRHQVNRLEGGPPACTLCSGGDYRFEPRPVSGEGADQSFEMVDRGAEKYCRLLEEQGIIAGLIGDDRVRLVFYKEIGARRLRRWCG